MCHDMKQPFDEDPEPTWWDGMVTLALCLSSLAVAILAGWKALELIGRVVR